VKILNKIKEADDLNLIKLILSRQLTEDHFIIEKMAVQIVSLMIALVCDKEYNSGTIEEKNIKNHKKIECEPSSILKNTNNQKPMIKSFSLKSNIVKIKRMENIVGSALLVAVTIDHNEIFYLYNGEEKTIDIQNGKHKISATYSGEFDELDFEIQNNSKEFSIIINIKPSIKIIEINN
jgi:hypothetical protein